jgi:hypothetical protein
MICSVKRKPSFASSVPGYWGGRALQLRRAPFAIRISELFLRMACQTKLRKMNAEFSPPSHKASAGRLRVFTSFRSEVWWRRGESNPRPRIVHVGLYIHSPNSNFRPRDTFRARWLKSYPDYMFASLRFRPLRSAILLVDAPICSRRKEQQDVSRLRS